MAYWTKGVQEQFYLFIIIIIQIKFLLQIAAKLYYEIITVHATITLIKRKVRLNLGHCFGTFQAFKIAKQGIRLS